jgi:hypothetical protein
MLSVQMLITVVSLVHPLHPLQYVLVVLLVILVLLGVLFVGPFHPVRFRLKDCTVPAEPMWSTSSHAFIPCMSVDSAETEEYPFPLLFVVQDVIPWW